MAKPVDPEEARTLLRMVVEEQEHKLRERVMADRPPVGVAVERMADVEAREIAWLWERWIPSRMLTLLGGYGGDGKSTVMASLIGRWTTARELPDGSVTGPVNVLMLSAEDDVAYALRPLRDHRADDAPTSPAARIGEDRPYRTREDHPNLVSSTLPRTGENDWRKRRGSNPQSQD